MPASQEKICSQCRGHNPIDGRYCWYCGAPLTGLFVKSGRTFSVGRFFVRASRWLIALAVLTGIGLGAYYALDRLVWPAVADRGTADEGSATSTISALVASTTSTTEPRLDRVVGGGTRYATAIAVSQAAFPTTAPAVILAGGEDFSSALAVAPLAAAYDGPILLVPPDGIDDSLSMEMARLSPQEVFLVGVNHASQVEQQLGKILDSPDVTDLSGADPYKTAANVAGQIQKKLGQVEKVVIAPADSFIEAIAVGPLAAARGWPILTAPTQGGLPKATSQAIADLSVDSALVVGNAVEPGNLNTVEHQSGTNGFDTATLIIKYALSEGASFSHTAIATGDSFPDGLVTSVLLAPDAGVLLLTKAGQLPSAMSVLLSDNHAAIHTLDFVALPDLARSMAQTASGAATTGTTSATTSGASN
jgi:putative cell wall-binding protein